MSGENLSSLHKKTDGLTSRPSVFFNQLIAKSQQLFFVASKSLPHECGESSTNHGSHDEDPNIGKSLTASEDCRSEGTGRVDGGAGEVDADEVHEDEGQTDGETGEVARTEFAVGGTQYHEHEDEGGDDLHEASAPDAAGVSHAIAAETPHAVSDAFSSRSHDVDERQQASTSKDTADELADPVDAGLFPGHTAGKRHREGDGGVDVATGDAADGVGHSDHGETESNSRAHDTSRSGTTQEHSRSAA